MRRIRTWMWVLALLTVGVLLAPPCRAQQREAPPEALEDGVVPPEELRRAMGEFFANRLRAELALSDEQAEQVMPHLRRLESEGHELRRERGETIRQLREGLESGASDDELKRLLEAHDQVERSQLDLRKAVLAEVDQALSVRQSIRLRFFLERFPRQVREKLEEIRGLEPHPRMGDGRRPGRAR